ncbi:4Fe-4S dicluster domain-containing protein [Clostridium estertheticum]|uniref:4Fe-4S dicluster domain-containing protein n=1 Tax=Clostridium estertheticum TaxID=238834 RepID=A0A5N7IV77_9CLOT|nr:EFR1 family ferrodoxin [Clostridium estertheticum]MPQ34203.1 4Fe-4S dicluster domain-containing protein [Clostridium estertheticum]MPQ64626.1 4Fe-4S dicluster domain-containing protein [Clostridium estertheticum]
MNEDVLIICESVYNGNTLKLATAMAGELNCLLVNTKEAENLDLRKYKTIGFGSGIFFARHAPILMEFISKLEFSEQPAFVFSTHGSPILGKYHKPLKTLLTKKGRTIIGEFSTKGYDCTGPFTIVGGGNKGKPNESDQRKAARFISKLFPKYKRIDDYLSLTHIEPLRDGVPNVYKIKKDGNEIVLKGDIVTVNQNKCIGCGKCLKNCPLGIFELRYEKSAPIRELDCVQCRLCQSYCPTRVIYLHGTWKDSIRVAKRHLKR